MLRIVFAGTPEFARVALHHLLNDQSLDLPPFEIVAVYTQPDRPSGRGLQMLPSPVKALALTHGLPVEQPLSLRKAEAQTRLRELAPDLMIVAAYGLILPQVVLDIPRLGCLNIHGSLLPRWRGAAPIVRAIQAGDQETGVGIMKMEAGLDTGPVFLEERLVIGPLETAGQLHDRLAELGAQALLKALPGIVAGTLPAVTQSEQGVTYAHKILKDEAPLDWSHSAFELANKVRAFDPFPGATTKAGERLFKVWGAKVIALDSNTEFQQGTVLRVGATDFDVQCGRGVLQVHSAQLPGAKRLAGAPMMQALKTILAPTGANHPLVLS